VVETFTERFKPFVHPIDILIALSLRNDILDNGVLRIGQRLIAVKMGGGKGDLYIGNFAESHGFFDSANQWKRKIGEIGATCRK
jgi:hypothetical protein